MSKHRRSTLLVSVTAALALVTWAGAAAGGRDASSFGFRTVLSGLANPVDVASAPGDASTLYVVEQAGTIKIVRDGRLAGTFLDIRDRVHTDGNELGLLSSYSAPGTRRTTSSTSTTPISRATRTSCSSSR